MSATPPSPIRTPCTKVCFVDFESGLCLGCFRTPDEIAGWSTMSPADRDTVMDALPARRTLIRPEKLGPA